MSASIRRPFAYCSCSAGESVAPHGFDAVSGRTTSALSAGTTLREIPTRPGTLVTRNSRSWVSGM